MGNGVDGKRNIEKMVQIGRRDEDNWGKGDVVSGEGRN
jgi:hypothetical protein